MKRFGLLALVLMLCCAACSKGGGNSPPGKGGAETAVEGAAAPDFAVKDLAGKEIRLAELRGKVVFLNFWATWCPPCREEVPSIAKLNGLMAGKQFKMLAVSIDEGGKEAIEKYFKASGQTLPAYLDTDRKISTLYGTTGVPETFIIDGKGIIVKKVIGAVNWSDPQVVTFLDGLATRR